MTNCDKFRKGISFQKTRYHLPVHIVLVVSGLISFARYTGNVDYYNLLFLPAHLLALLIGDFFDYKRKIKFVAKLLRPSLFYLTAVIYTHESTG